MLNSQSSNIKISVAEPPFLRVVITTSHTTDERGARGTGSIPHITLGYYSTFLQQSYVPLIHLLQQITLFRPSPCPKRTLKNQPSRRLPSHQPPNPQHPQELNPLEQQKSWTSTMTATKPSQCQTDNQRLKEPSASAFKTKKPPPLLPNRLAQ
jgi:hypothetical protein